ncbi:MAG: DUF3833 family protein [Gemmatimonadales bacterium]
MKRSRQLAGVTLALLMTACLAGFRLPKAPAAGPVFRPEQFFIGFTHGDGVLATRGRRDRKFYVTGVGRVASDGTFILDQKIRYADGATDERSFRVRRINDHDYAGTLSGVAGPVTARVDGNSFHVRYLIRKPAVTMDQWIYLQPDGLTALNRSTVKILGIPVAHLSETITRM